MRHSLILSIFLFVSHAPNLHSAEIDSFTDRDPKMSCALSEVNRLTQELFNSAVKTANEKNTCNARHFREALRREVGGSMWSNIELAMKNSDKFDKRRSEPENSIYRDIKMLESLGINLGKLNDILRIGDVYVGTDKFGHFFDQGYSYFEIMYREDGGIEGALAYGEASERELFGKVGSGIYSHGDLAANYDGFNFWRQATGTDLRHGESPYFLCKNDQWTQQRTFDWADYVNAAWDEGQNCNEYRNESMKARVEKRIRELGEKRGVRMICPIEPERCEEMINRYGPYAKRIITPICFEN